MNHRSEKEDLSLPLSTPNQPEEEEEEQISSSDHNNNNKLIIEVLTWTVITIGTAMFVAALWFINSPYPEFRITTVTATNVTVTAVPSFAMELRAEFEVKNKNFGSFSYRDTKAAWLYRNAGVIGEGLIGKRTLWGWSAERFNMSVQIESGRVSDVVGLGLDLGRGVLPISAQARINGKVETTKKREYIKVWLRCNMWVDLNENEVKDLNCE